MTNKSIILFDFDNLHGQTMNLMLSSYNDNVIGEKIDDNNLISSLDKYKDVLNQIICIPLAGNFVEANETIERLAGSNIVIAPYDNEYIFPGSLKNIIVADKKISLNFDNNTLNGNCAYCIWLSTFYSHKKE